MRSVYDEKLKPISFSLQNSLGQDIFWISLSTISNLVEIHTNDLIKNIKDFNWVITDVINRTNQLPTKLTYTSIVHEIEYVNRFVNRKNILR
jgi:hypothetical protein